MMAAPWSRSRQGSIDANGIGDFPLVIHRDVIVHADEDLFPFDIDISYGFLFHEGMLL
jgi:hypothetical protein